MDSFSGYHIDSIIDGNLKCAWRLTRFYGEPEASHRNDGWNMLRMLSSKPKLSWCCFGDFNELLEVQDKKGGVPRDHNLMENFHEVLDVCGFFDLGYSGLDFTWKRRRRGELIWERLDIGVANYEWLTKFPTSRVRHLNCFTSNHHPILLSLDVGGEHHKWRRKPFRFKVIWVTDSRCKDTISRAWNCSTGGTPMYATAMKLKQCKHSLKVWSRDHFGMFKVA